MGKTANYRRERKRERVGVKAWQNDALSVVWKSQSLRKTCVYKWGRNAAGDLIKINEKSEKDR
jgi:hypothetical protein